VQRNRAFALSRHARHVVERRAIADAQNQSVVGLRRGGRAGAGSLG